MARLLVAALEGGPGNLDPGAAEDTLEVIEPRPAVPVVAAGPVEEQGAPKIDRDGSKLQASSENFAGRLSRKARAPSAGSPVA